MSMKQPAKICQLLLFSIWLDFFIFSTVVIEFNWKNWPSIMKSLHALSRPLQTKKFPVIWWQKIMCINGNVKQPSYCLIDNIYVRFGSSVFRQVIGIPKGTNSAPLLADLFLHTFKYDFMVKTMKHDITKAIQFSNTFRYIDDLFSINNVDFGNYISAIYPCL